MFKYINPVIFSLLLIFFSQHSYSEINKKEGTNSNSQVAKENLKDILNLKVNSTPKRTELVISNIGSRVNVKKEINGSNFIAQIYAQKNVILHGGTQSLSLPSLGIKVASINGSNKNYTLKIVSNKIIDFTKISILNRGEDLVFSFPKSTSISNNLNNENPFEVDSIESQHSSYPFINRAIAPPLGDIAIGTTEIPNPNLININGPNVSLTFEKTESRKAIEFLLSKVDYGFVWVKNDPLFTSSNNASSGYPSSGNSADKTADSPRFITLNLKDETFSKALNAVLIASGLQARLENGIIYVGPNVRNTVFSNRISRIYRLNQTTANAAASYLANLGAKVTKTSTISTAVTEGASQSETVAGGSTASTTTQSTKTSVEVYGSDIGPLVGLIATTDDRLQTITLIGTKNIIGVAEGYLKKLDLRQRQVALTVRILDVNLSDGTTIDNSWAMRQNNNFIVNDNGKLLAAFGEYLPPNEATDFGDSNTAKSITTDTSSTPAETSSYSRRLRLSPVLEYKDLNFINFLRTQIASKNTKILASPTLILNEYPGKAGGETVSFSSISSSLTAGSIGRSFGNEGFVIVGTQVPVNCTAAEDSTVPSFTYGIKGLTFGARIMKIDDNGFVTFTISPSVTLPSEQRNITNCGTIDLLATRRLDSGAIRVRDGHTLILTGVLNTTDKETVTKFPLLGDLPLIGQLFRNTASAKEQNELVILVTPQILKGGGENPIKLDKPIYAPKSDDAKKLINDK